jgi:hypothetical protein
MNSNIKESIVASDGSSISNSTNSKNINVRKIRQESAIISFIVGIISSIVANVIWEILRK